MVSFPWDLYPSVVSHPDIGSRSADAPLQGIDATPAQPPRIDDIFADERHRLQTQTHALIGQAAILRRQLTSLIDQQQRMCTNGEPPAFDADCAALTWLRGLPTEIFRAAPPAGTPLELAVARASAKFGVQRVTVGASMTDVVMQLDVSAFSARQMRALGLRKEGMLTLTAHFDPAYHQAPEPPSLTIEYRAPHGMPQVATSAVTDAKHHFRLGYQMLNLLTRHLQQAWSSGPSAQVLVDLFSLASGRLPTLAQHCVVCDQKTTATQLRPTTCHATDCIGQAETWGYGFEPQDVIQNPEVADLLISMTAAAATLGRDAFFKRLPMAFRISGVTDFAAMTREINQLPAIDTLVCSSDMIGTLDAVSPMALTTLSWLMVSNEGFLEHIPAHQQYPDLDTPHQFRIFGGPLEREEAFVALPGQDNNRFAFHGSPFGNWHSILRTGLVVGSHDSGLGYNGAACGPGVYVSNDVATSMHYSHAGSGWQNSRIGAGPSCVALCETNGGSLTTGVGRPLGNIEVFPNASAVALRYLFVFPGGTRRGGVNAQAAARYLKAHASDAESKAYITRLKQRGRWLR